MISLKSQIGAKSPFQDGGWGWIMGRERFDELKVII